MSTRVTGKRTRKTSPLSPILNPGHARLVLVAGDCPVGLTFSLSGNNAIAGRKGDHIPLTEDRYVNAKHAVFSYEHGALQVSDAGSLNGVFVRITEPREIKNGDEIRVGNQFFRFEELRGGEHVGPDGTQFYASPKRKGSFRLLQMMEGGRTGLSSMSSSDELIIGGEGTSIAFTADPYLSANHARAYRAESGEFFVEDMGSTNGTYLRIKTSASLTQGDFLYLGNELFRVEMT